MPILLIRHGESEGNASGVIQGRLDVGLTALGRQQAGQTAEALAYAEPPIEGVVSSVLQRARMTADIIAERLGIPVELDEDLVEYDHGELSGLTRQQIGERFPHLSQSGIAVTRDGTWPSIPGEEGRDVLFARAQRALERLQADGRNVAVVTHGGFINAACHAVLGLDYVNKPQGFRSGNAGVSEIRLDRQGRPILHRHNDACHLKIRTQPLEA